MEHEKLRIFNDQHETIEPLLVQLSTPKAIGMKHFISGFLKKSITPYISIFS